ncbi:hypothetical protein CKO31_12155 [Thiohalocapsa halophila]|uniref:PilY1 beta-propeller domain-containing protein n=2 Tax=Thiohalocapsa halophila TaxID=69359 RepID=A0ABS1CJE3_9GAMM|nr:hypothetical protein [Thiohalocapsa halophila]
MTPGRRRDSHGQGGPRTTRRLCTLARAPGAAALGLAMAAAASDMPDEIPPFLSEGTGPNLVITVDDSQSMERAFFGPKPWGQRDEFAAGSRWLASPDANPVYFNPQTTYRPAKDATGIPLAIDDANGQFSAYPFRGEAACNAHRDNLSGQQYQPVAADGAGDPDTCSPTRIDSGLEQDSPYYYAFDGDARYRVVPDAQAGEWMSSASDVPVSYEACAAGESGCDHLCSDEHPSPGFLTPDPCFEKRYVADLPWDPDARCGAGLDGDCPQSAAENFVTWYKYYRTRMLTVKTVLSRVLQDLDGGVRVTYQGLPQADWAPGTTHYDNLVTRFQTFSRNRSTLFAWLFDLAPTNDKPLVSAHIRAGEFASQGISLADDIASHGCRANPGADDPDSDNMCGARCRKNFHVMFTDGAWDDDWGNGGGASGQGGGVWPEGTGDPADGSQWLEDNWDGDSAAAVDLPTDAASPFGAIDYTPTAPYKDTNTGMLADAAFYYWARDLREDVDNDVPILLGDLAADADTDSAVNFWNPDNNPADWQHLSLFTISYGLEGIVESDQDGDLDYGQYRSGSTLYDIWTDGFPSCKAAGYDFDDDNNPDTAPAGGINEPCELAIAGRQAQIPPAAKADDLFHAALNARGRHFSASAPEALVASFENVLDAVAAASDKTVTNAPVALTAGDLSEDTRIFQAVTDAPAWLGEIRSLRVSTGSQPADHDCHTVARGELCDTAQDPYQTTRADDAFPAAADRVIFTFAEGTGEPALFNAESFDALSAEQQDGLTGGDPQLEVARDYIDWLRGDPVEGFRKRDTPLGDILGSGPLAVGPPRQVFADADYVAFKEAHKDRKMMVYVGANDGMLHAFDADSSTAALIETFAYVPGAVYDGLADLADPAYGGGDPKKQAFVDGPLSYSDAQLADADGTTNDWRSILVGSFGAGAQGIFALDVTDPDPPNSAAGASDVVLWEFTDASGNDDGRDGRDMGYSFGKPAIVRIDDAGGGGDEPAWVVLVGNGYENRSTQGENAAACGDAQAGSPTNCTVSQTGNAVLYVLNLAGEDAQRIRGHMDTLEGSEDAPDTAAAGDNAAPCSGESNNDDPADSRSNGLGEVSTLDEDGDLVADRAYAGDLFGNLWRFDLTDLDATPVKIFTAEDADGNRQPITTRIAFVRHPNGGHMLLFGTGRFLSTADKHDDSVQTFYGIWDADRYWSGDSFDIPERGDLLQHAFTADDIAVNGDGGIVSLGRISTATPTNTVTEPRGWMIDLVPVGDNDASAECSGAERIASAPQVRQGRVVFVSVIPGGACVAGGVSWINALDAIDGSRLSVTPFDFNLDGYFDEADLLAAQAGERTVGSSIRVTAESEAGIYSAPAMLGLGGGELMSILSDSAGNLLQLEESNAYGWRTWLQLE